MSDTKGKPKPQGTHTDIERWRRLLNDSGEAVEATAPEDSLDASTSTPLAEVQGEAWEAATARWDALVPKPMERVVAAAPAGAANTDADIAAAWEALDPALQVWARRQGASLPPGQWAEVLAQIKERWDATWHDAVQLQQQLQAALRLFLAGPGLVAKRGGAPIDRPFAFFHSDTPLATGLDEDGMWCVAAPHQECQFHVFASSSSWFALLQLADASEGQALPELLFPMADAHHQRLEAGFHHLFNYEAPARGSCRFLALFFSTPLSGLPGWPESSEAQDSWSEESLASRVQCLLQHAEASSSWLLTLECEGA